MMTKRAAVAPAQGNNQTYFPFTCCVCVCFPRCFFLLTNEPLSLCDAPEFSFSLRQLLLLMRLFITELLYYYYYKHSSSFGVIL